MIIFSLFKKKAKSKGLKIVTFGKQNKSDFYLSKKIINKGKKNDILIVKAKMKY